MTSIIGVKKIQHPNGTQVMTFDTAGKISSNVSSTGNITTTGTVNTPSINGGQIGGRRNIIINGAMQVAQRSTQVTSASGTGYFSIDRMKYYESSDVVATIEQVSDAPSGSGFEFSHKVTATTADSSLGGTDLVCPLWYIVEKRDVDARLAYGTSSAKPITMSFWIKSNVTGTYTISAYRSATPARVQAQTYTISAANTWEFKTLTFLGDTAEAIDTDLNFYFNGLVGGNYDNTSTTSGWATYDTGNWAGGHTATWGDTTNDTWQITGLQLEVGSQATPFEHRSFAEELTLCHRYCRSFTSLNFGRARDGDSYYGGGLIFNPPMRATPTLKSGATYTNNTGNAGTPGINSGQGPSADSIQLYNSGSSWTTNSFPKLTGIFEAEL